MQGPGRADIVNAGSGCLQKATAGGGDETNHLTQRKTRAVGRASWRHPLLAACRDLQEGTETR
ncbi:unnamed protein product, partial [Staurois parvus]